MTLFAAFAMAVLLLVSPPARSVAGDDGWEDAHATFYGDETGSDHANFIFVHKRAHVPDTLFAAAGTCAHAEGACGYGNLFDQGYGLSTTALSSALFNDGWSCGACFELQCQNSTYCKPGGASVTVTATNSCPANYSKPNENWCNPPQRHFDLSKPMFLRLATDFRVGIIPVRYRRVPCIKSGGVRFQMMGNRCWVAVLVFNVAGDGEVQAVAVKGSNNNGDGTWMDMTRNWGQVWNADPRFVGQGLSFRVVAADGRAVVMEDVVPPGWAFGQSFQATGQFS